MEINFDKIVLTNTDRKNLKKLSKSALVRINESDMRRLLNHGFISVHEIGADNDGFPLYDDFCTLTDAGKEFIIYKKSLFKTKLIEWIRYGITTIIALTALIISIVK